MSSNSIHNSRDNGDAEEDDDNKQKRNDVKNIISLFNKSTNTNSTNISTISGRSRRKSAALGGMLGDPPKLDVSSPVTFKTTAGAAASAATTTATTATTAAVAAASATTKKMEAAAAKISDWKLPKMNIPGKHQNERDDNKNDDDDTHDNSIKALNNSCNFVGETVRRSSVVFPVITKLGKEAAAKIHSTENSNYFHRGKEALTASSSFRALRSKSMSHIISDEAHVEDIEKNSGGSLVRNNKKTHNKVVFAQHLPAAELSDTKQTRGVTVESPSTTDTMPTSVRNQAGSTPNATKAKTSDFFSETPKIKNSRRQNSLLNVFESLTGGEEMNRPRIKFPLPSHKSDSHLLKFLNDSLLQKSDEPLADISTKSEEVIFTHSQPKAFQDSSHSVASMPSNNSSEEAKADTKDQQQEPTVRQPPVQCEEQRKEPTTKSKIAARWKKNSETAQQQEQLQLQQEQTSTYVPNKYCQRTAPGHDEEDKNRRASLQRVRRRQKSASDQQREEHLNRRRQLFRKCISERSIMLQQQSNNDGPLLKEAFAQKLGLIRSTSNSSVGSASVATELDLQELSHRLSQGNEALEEFHKNLNDDDANKSICDDNVEDHFHSYDDLDDDNNNDNEQSKQQQEATVTDQNGAWSRESVATALAMSLAELLFANDDKDNTTPGNLLLKTKLSVNGMRNIIQISVEDMKEMLLHIDLCARNNTPIRWDLIQSIIFPDDYLNYGVVVENTSDTGIYEETLPCIEEQEQHQISHEINVHPNYGNGVGGVDQNRDDTGHIDGPSMFAEKLRTEGRAKKEDLCENEELIRETMRTNNASSVAELSQKDPRFLGDSGSSVLSSPTGSTFHDSDDERGVLGSNSDKDENMAGVEEEDKDAGGLHGVDTQETNETDAVEDDETIEIEDTDIEEYEEEVLSDTLGDSSSDASSFINSGASMNNVFGYYNDDSRFSIDDDDNFSGFSLEAASHAEVSTLTCSEDDSSLFTEVSVEDEDNIYDLVSPAGSTGRTY